MDNFEYVIIGNGILGIHLARFLDSKNKKYIILEKSKNVGGRFASRRFDDYKFNFGPRQFEWDGFFFKEEIDIGLKNNHLVLKNGLIHSTSTFNEWTKEIAKSLNVLQVQVDNITKTEDGKYIINDFIGAKNIIITTPAGQCYNLVKDLGDYNYLNEVSYLKESFYMYSSSNSYKDISGLTLINAISKNSTNYYFCSIDVWDESSREELKAKYDSKINPIESFAHKWRYSRVDKTTNYKQVNANIYCLGDYYEGEVKGSYNSAVNVKPFI